MEQASLDIYKHKMHGCVCACVRACVRVHVRVSVSVCVLYSPSMHRALLYAVQLLSLAG